MQDFKTIDEFVRFLETVPAGLFTSESSYESLDDDDSSDDAFDDCCHSCATLSCWPKSYNDPMVDRYIGIPRRSSGCIWLRGDVI